jgi:hypothetical protein
VWARPSTTDGGVFEGVLLLIVRGVVEGTEPGVVRRIACRSRRAEPSATARKLG